MSRVREVAELLARYRGPLAFNIVFNALGAVLSLFTFLSVVPFLRILFVPAAAPAQPAAPAADPGLLDRINSGFDGYVAEHGAEHALLMLCVALVVLAVVMLAMAASSVTACGRRCSTASSNCRWAGSPTRGAATR